jgi:tetratricopeptide (TPR) repeat protein/TolB-like protein
VTTGAASGRDQPDPAGAAACRWCGGLLADADDCARLLRCTVCGFLHVVPRTDLAPAHPSRWQHGTPLAPGTVIRGRYRLVDLLGMGTHGLTFLALHELLNHPCVVKVLPFQATAADEAARRLRKEASAGFLVNHPHVVRVLDCDVFEDRWYLATEFIDGVDLARVIQAGQRLPWRQAAEFLRAAAAGLSAIHQAGLVHRDVKPGNLLLGSDGQVRVADLGLAAFRQHRRAPGAPERVGTLLYAAPEMFADDDAAACAPAADLYSLGAVIFELLTGALPHGRSLYRMLLRDRQRPVAWPADLAPDVPPRLVRTILRLLHPDPQQRFRSAEVLLARLGSGRQSARAGSAAPKRAGSDGVVVATFQNGSSAECDEWLGHALADRVARGLSQLRGLYVADRQEYQRTLERVRGRPWLSPMQAMREAGRLSGAGAVVLGAFRREEDRIHVSASVLGVDEDAQPIEEVCGAACELATMEAVLVGRLARALGRTVPAAQPPVVRSLAAEERFIVGKRAFLRGDYDIAVQAGREAIELDAEYGEAIGFVGVCHARMGRYEEAVEYNTRQQQLATRTGDRRLSIEAHSNLGTMHYFRGDYAAATRSLTRAARLACELGLSSDVALIRNNLGFVLLDCGHAAAAERMFRSAIRTHLRHGAVQALIGPYNGLGHVLRERERYGEARTHFRRALALAQESDDLVNAGIAYINLGRCALLQGRHADAKHELALALNLLEPTHFWNGLARVYEHMTELNLALGDYAEAVRCADCRMELAQRHANRRIAQAARQQKAEALRRAQRVQEAELCLAGGGDGAWSGAP